RFPPLRPWFAAAPYFKIDNQRRISNATVLCRRGDCLVSNVLGSGRVNGILRDIGRVVPDALEAAGNENQVEVTPELLWVLRLPIGKFAIRHFVHVIEI